MTLDPLSVPFVEANRSGCLRGLVSGVYKYECHPSNSSTNTRSLLVVILVVLVDLPTQGGNGGEGYAIF